MPCAASRRISSCRLPCGIAKRWPPEVTISAGTIASVSGRLILNSVP